MNMSLWEEDPLPPTPRVKFPQPSLDQTGIDRTRELAVATMQMCETAAALVPHEQDDLYLLVLRDNLANVSGLGHVRANALWAFERTALYTLYLEAVDPFWQKALQVMWWALEPDGHRMKPLEDYFAELEYAYSVRVGAGEKGGRASAT